MATASRPDVWQPCGHLRQGRLCNQSRSTEGRQQPEMGGGRWCPFTEPLVNRCQVGDEPG
eukprot:16432841-Heterocapsa_arctica.AAC.1